MIFLRDQVLSLWALSVEFPQQTAGLIARWKSTFYPEKLGATLA
jgi:hypothetical protein